MSYLVNIIPFIILGVVLFFILKKQKRKEDKYFGKKVSFTKKELKTLEKYKAEYTEIEFDSRLPSFKNNGFELVDIARSATEMIYDNPIPNQREKENIENGDDVKLKFMDKDQNVERMWVEVAERDRNVFKGILKNDSFSIHNLVNEKEVWFHSNHIFEIRHK